MEGESNKEFSMKGGKKNMLFFFVPSCSRIAFGC